MELRRGIELDIDDYRLNLVISLIGSMGLLSNYTFVENLVPIDNNFLEAECDY